MPGALPSPPRPSGSISRTSPTRPRPASERASAPPSGPAPMIATGDMGNAVFYSDAMVGIVTGGSQGIGMAIARAFLARGLQVKISARQEAALEDAARRLAGGDKVLTVRADVREAGDAQRLVGETVKRVG